MSHNMSCVSNQCCGTTTEVDNEMEFLSSDSNWGRPYLIVIIVHGGSYLLYNAAGTSPSYSNDDETKRE